MFILLASWLLLSSAAEPSPAELAARLVAAEGATNTHELKGLPGWLEAEVLAYAEPAPAIDATAPAAELTIALLWVGAAHEVHRAHELERYLDDPRAGVRLPRSHVTQQVNPDGYGVSWHDVSVSEAALDALRALAGESFATAEAYRAYRAEQGPLHDNPRVWLHTYAYGHKDAFAALPIELQLRTRALSSSRLGVDEADFRRLWLEHIGRERTMAQLTTDARWPEYSSEGHLVRLARWAVYLLEADDLDQLWSHPSFPDRARGDLVVAWSRAHPEDGGARLKAAYDDAAEAPVLAELVRAHTSDHGEMVVQQVDVEDEDAVIAVFEAAGHAGPSARGLVGQLVARIQADDAAILREAIDATRAVGVTVDLPLRDDIYPVLRKSGAPDLSVTAREDCLRRLRDAL